MASAAALLLLACHAGRKPSGDSDTSSTSAVALDTARGIVSVVGSEPMTAVILAPASGEGMVAIEGSQESTLRRLSGLEVMAIGRRTTRRSMSASPGGVTVFEADSFVVRAADRVAAHDGVVTLEAGKFYLVMPWGGKRAADFLPAALREKVGARVFLVGPLDRAPASYGVIAERR